MISASFEISDDLLWQARSGNLLERGPIDVQRSGRIGPLVELAMAMKAVPDEYAQTTVSSPFYDQILKGISHKRVSGARASDMMGVFPASRLDPAATSATWHQWLSHAANAATNAGLHRSLAAGLIGALGELQDNLFQHSGAPQTGLIAYAARLGSFEFVVADAGIGVLASLRQSSLYSYLQDSGEALRVAASDGASRFGSASGRGYGIGQLFRALARDSAELRFRSGDHSLRLWGDAPSLTGKVEVAQKAFLDGLTISVRCIPTQRAS